MNAIRTILVTATAVLAASAHAQVCSGGPEGGMDASGNQCGHFHPVVSNTAPTKVNSPSRSTASGSRTAAAGQVAVDVANSAHWAAMAADRRRFDAASPVSASR